MTSRPTVEEIRADLIGAFDALIRELGRERAESAHEMIAFPDGTVSRASRIGVWHPISSAPKDETYILLYAPNERPQFAVGMWPDYKNAWSTSDWFDSAQPTHWMPLIPPEAA